jgi:bifunctional DNA-binding transcriptional regulator/antitoxin component of YhaV-PrlF toxin-antitoxin module
MEATRKIPPRGQLSVPPAIRQAAGLKCGDLVTFRATGPGKIEITVVPTLTLAEMLERYRIEGPIDEAADREVWQAVAAKDVLGA